MSEDIKALLDFMQQYVDEPNVPDYSGEYPPCWEIGQEEVDKILNYIKEIKTENKQLKEQLQLYETYLNRFFKINNKSYDGKVVLDKLQQREEVIEEIKDKLLCYGETFDSEIHQQFQNETLNILNKYKKEESE